MPNHVTNYVKLHGEESEILRLLQTVKSDEFGLGTIDFNKIIPMPDDIYCGDLGPKERELYGEKNWYDWRISNWGTKWNAYGYSEDHQYNNDRKIYFLTAWAAPHPVIEKLSEMFPYIKIEHEWADEDIGMNCGRYVYYDGERIEEYYPESHKECLEFAARVLDISLEEDRALYLNASETGYINIEGDDEYEHIEIFGQPALFTNERITDENIPKGMYCYHLRHGDDGSFTSIEKRVTADHAGSVVTKEPIDLGEKGYISFTEDTTPNFIGDMMSLYEFREYNTGESEDMTMSEM